MQKCKVCEDEKPLSEYYPARPGKFYSTCKKCVIARNYERLKKNPPTKDQRLRWTYGITEARYEAMLESQNGKCAICEDKTTAHPKVTRLAVDHDHSTGKVRGLVCNTCNQLLGKSTETLDRLKRAVAYLERTTHV